MYTGKDYLQESEASETRGKVCSKEEFSSIEDDSVRETFKKLERNKSIDLIRYTHEY